VVAQIYDPTKPAVFGPGSILTIDSTTGKVFTIASQFTTLGTLKLGANWIEMDADNNNLMVGGLPQGATPTTTGNGVYMHRVGPDGSLIGTPVADTAAGIGYVNSFDLDGDGTWIIGGGTRVWSYNHNTNAYSTLFNATSPSGTVNALVLDPLVGRGGIVLGKFNSNSASTACLVDADRTGVRTTINTTGPPYVTGVRVDYAADGYLSSGFGANFDGTGDEFSRTTRGGAYTALNNGKTPMYRANGIYVDKQRLSWVLTYDVRSVTLPPASPSALVCSVYKVDPDGVFITLYRYSTTLTRAVFAPAGITKYGSRHVVCNGSGKPGTSVKVRFTSRKPGDAGKRYQLAASFGNRNPFAIKFANGEYLDLAWDSLLWLSANDLTPALFQDFRGNLDAFGEAEAAVNIPGGLPSGLRIPIFVSGIVIDPAVPGGVRTVGNTHWFILN